MQFNSIRKTLLALSVASVLAGCGGSSSSSDDDNSIDATLQGVAAKGIIINGLVTADELNGDGTVKNANIGSATTNAQGRYSLQTNDSYEGGPIEIKISKGADTTMVCDAASGCGNRTDDVADSSNPTSIDFGEQYKPAALNMSALIADAEEGESIDVQITPFTNMAAQRARSGGTLDATSIDAANSEVSNLLGGVDILRTEPVDITDLEGDESASAVAYAALTAAIAEVATDDADGQPDLTAAIDSLASGFAAGTFSADTLGEIVSAAQDTFDEAGAADTSGVLDNLEDTVVAAGEGGTIDPAPSENAGDSNVELAKDFLQELRTWGTVIGNEVDNPSQAFEDQIEMAEQVWDFVDGGNGPGLAATVTAIIDRADGVIEADGSLAGYANEEGSFSAGTISTAEVSDGIEYTVTDAAILTEEGDATVSMVAILPADGSEVSSLVIGIQSASAVDDYSEATINSGTATVDFVAGATLVVDLAAEDQEIPEIDTIEFDLDVAFTNNATLSELGVVTSADPITYTGEIAFTAFAINDPDGEIVEAVPSTLVFNGSASNSANSFDFTTSLSIPGAAEVTTESPILALDSTYADNNAGARLTEWSYDGNTFTYDSPSVHYDIVYIPDSSQNGNLSSVSYSWSYAWGQEGGYVDDRGQYSNIQEAVNGFFIDDYTSSIWVEGQGEYRLDFEELVDYADDGFRTFFLVEQDVELDLDGEPASVGIQFNAQFDGTQPAEISITGQQTGLDAGNVSVSISYGDRSIVFTAEGDDTDASGDITITNTDGVELIISAEDGDEVGDVTINDVVIASISEIDDDFLRVDFIDGTFEIY